MGRLQAVIVLIHVLVRQEKHKLHSTIPRLDSVVEQKKGVISLPDRDVLRDGGGNGVGEGDVGLGAGPSLLRLVKLIALVGLGLGGFALRGDALEAVIVLFRNERLHFVFEYISLEVLIFIKLNKKCKMSVTVSTVEQISRSNCNNSPSKHLYSFSKDSRFKSPKTYTQRISYDLPSDFEKQFLTMATTFGVERPNLFHTCLKERTKKPSPFHYSLPSSFNVNTNGRVGLGTPSRVGTPSRNSS